MTPRRTVRAASRDDVWQELIFDGGDLVLERELPLFETPQDELVREAALRERQNLLVQIAMLSPEFHELLAHLPVVLTLHFARFAETRRPCAVQ